VADLLGGHGRGLTEAVQRAYGQPVTAGPLLRFGIDLLTELIKEMQS